MKFLLIHISYLVFFFLVYFGLLGSVIYFFYWSSLFWFLFFILYFLQIIFLVTKIIINHHFFIEYQRFWIFLIISFPFLGTFLYFLYGTKSYYHSSDKKYWKTNLPKIINLEKEGFKNQQAFLNFKNLPIQSKNIFNFLQNYSQHPLYSDVPIELIFDTYTKTKKIKKDFQNAQNYIYISYYIFNDGLCLEWFTDLLIQQAKRNIKIYLVFDFYGRKIWKKDFQKLRNAGIKFANFGKSFKINHDFFYVNHRKCIVIDGKVGYVGGFNIGDPHANISPLYGFWIDTHFRFTGQAVKSLEAIFLKDWLYLTHALLPTLPQKQKKMKKINDQNHQISLFQLVDQTPRIKKNINKDLFFNLISSAKKTIYIASAYFFIDKSLEDVLISKAQEGVEVNIFLPEFISIPLVVDIGRLGYSNLIKNNVNIYEVSNVYLHSKVCLIDQNISTIGSCNFDFHSFYYSSEITAVFHDSKINQTLYQNLFLKYNKSMIKITVNPLEKKGKFYRLFLKILKIAVLFF